MKLLADINVLLALAWPQHAHHERVYRWWKGLRPEDTLATCAITELGFVRISLQPPFSAPSIAQVKQALRQLRAARPGHEFILDDQSAADLPDWVTAAKQTTDGHLLGLAASHGAQLVTLDAGIPGAVKI
ncbi:MAG: TA system VapC family ribonuclease toxin [Opitutaceae bacterium]